jgi:hypothetical protein
MKDGITLTLASAFGSDDDARRRQRLMQAREGKDMADRLTKLLDTKVELPEDETTNQQNPQQAGAGRGTFPGFGGGGLQQQQMQQAQNMMQKMMGAQGGAGGAGGRRGPMGMPGFGGFGGQPAAATQEPPKSDKPSSNIKITIQEKTVVVLTISLVDQTANSRLINGLIRQEVIKQKGFLDMAGGASRIHDLATALRVYPDTHQRAFPRGTAERQIPSSRAGRPYPPNQRVSFFADLLPFLGPEQASLYSRIDFQQSWRDPDNLSVAATLVPQFLDPEKPPSTWWVRYPGNKEDSAATHLVGISGVGLDAAEYTENDPTVLHKRGIFGYDRATKLDDITDKKSETILLAQVPPTFKGPWMASGGSTVRGVPEKNSIQPFLSTQRVG